MLQLSDDFCNCLSQVLVTNPEFWKLYTTLSGIRDEVPDWEEWEYKDWVLWKDSLLYCIAFKQDCIYILKGFLKEIFEIVHE